MEQTTCATLIKAALTNNFLICHATETRHWSLPKGVFDSTVDSNLKEAAIRELEEETGIKVPDDFNLKFVGKYGYTLQKDFALFCYQLEEEIPISELNCSTLFKSHYSGKMIKEVDQYKWVSKDEMYKHLNPKQSQLLRNVESELEEHGF